MKKHTRHLVSLGALGVAVLVASVLGFPDIMRVVTSGYPASDPAIPRSFAGNRMAYAFALFSLFSTSSLAIRKLILIAAQLRAEDWRVDPDVGLYRMALAALLMVIVLGAAPDVLLLLLWGEASDPTMAVVMTLDRVCDGLTIIPFTAAIFLHVRADQFERKPNLGELMHAAPEVDVGPRDRSLFMVTPRRESIAENVKIVILVMVIAAGLALLK